MLKRYVKDNYYARFDTCSYAAEKQTLMLGSMQNYDKVTGAWNVGLCIYITRKCINITLNARFDTCSCHNCRETDLMLGWTWIADRLTNGQPEKWTPMLHPAKSRCNKSRTPYIIVFWGLFFCNSNNVVLPNGDMPKRYGQIGKQCRPRSDCSKEQSDLGLHCLLKTISPTA